MRADEFEDWLPEMRAEYARDMACNGGLSQKDAHRKAVADTQQLFPDNRPSSDQAVFVLEADGEIVGDLWIAEREAIAGRNLWIYDIRVSEECRGRGYGREAMLFAEEEAKRRGLDRVGLNVFAGNEVARRLYRSLGYVENAVVMSKRVK